MLELDNCPLVTDVGLEHLVNCTSLQRIELYDCQLITRAGIRRLRVGRPKPPGIFCSAALCQTHKVSSKECFFFLPKKGIFLTLVQIESTCSRKPS